MIRIIFIFLIVLTLTSQAMTAKKPPQILKKSQQLIMVITDSWHAHRGILQRFHRKNLQSSWQAASQSFAVVVGKNGLGWGANMHTFQLPGPYKKEGDNKAPAGVFPLGSTFGFAKMAPEDQKAAYMQIKKTTVCVDNPQSTFYNDIINSADHAKSSWESGEQMHTISNYVHGVIVNYNAKNPVKGAGSCIFMHVWDNEPEGTAGCTAMPKPKIEAINAWLNPQDHPVLVQLPKSAYAKLKIAWGLPSQSTN